MSWRPLLYLSLIAEAHYLFGDRIWAKLNHEAFSSIYGNGCENISGRHFHEVFFEMKRIRPWISVLKSRAKEESGYRLAISETRHFK